MTSERRSQPRIKMHRPVKVREADTGKYLPGVLVDYSVGGAMLRLDYPRRLPVGAAVSVGIAAAGRTAIIPAASMIPATVVRSLSHDQTQHIAVCFEQAASLAAAG